jgi:hypothetical protein
MNKLLKEAQGLLSISQVHVRDLRVEISDKENFMSLSRIKKSRQSYNTMVKIDEVGLSNEDGSNKRFYYLFRYAIGVRLINADDEGKEDAESLVVIEAEFDACYLAKKEVKKEALEAFSVNNVGYHIWPYWRELVQSSCAKMGINVIKVPYYKMTNKDPSEPTQEDK